MPRSVNHVASRARRKKILKLTRGYFGARKNVGMSYSQLMGALHKAGIEINRKVLADLAVNHPEAFKAVVDKVKVA